MIDAQFTSKYHLAGEDKGSKKTRTIEQIAHTQYYAIFLTIMLFIKSWWAIVPGVQVKHIIYLTLSVHIQRCVVQRPRIDHRQTSIDHDYLTACRLQP